MGKMYLRKVSFRRNIFVLFFSFIILTFPLLVECQPEDGVRKSYNVALAVLKDNPDYHAGRTAFVNVLEKNEDMVFTFKLLDAYGDEEAYRKGLERFVNVDKVDLIFTTGTRSTLPAVDVVKEIPVIFTAVADPVEGNIVKSLESPGGNVTGTHCAVPAYSQLKAIQKVFPDVKKIGIIYTKDEINAEIQTSEFKKIADELGLQVFLSTVSKDCRTEAEVAEATRKLVGKVDILIAHQDTSLSQYGRGMIMVAEENKIPTYVSLGHLLSQGAMMSLEINFSELGSISGRQAIEILRDGKKPTDIPVDSSKDYSLTINLAAANNIGLEIPIQALRSATRIIK
ncbi:MAG: ABC transporter substrate-binding protein [Candidatus Omnitrophica bacterium]|nr:ABC transporter substrate-binding protein [Candidatus Omnitrophota bacterium]